MVLCKVKNVPVGYWHVFCHARRQLIIVLATTFILLSCFCANAWRKNFCSTSSFVTSSNLSASLRILPSGELASSASPNSTQFETHSENAAMVKLAARHELSESKWSHSMHWPWRRSSVSKRQKVLISGQIISALSFVQVGASHCHPV